MADTDTPTTPDTAKKPVARRRNTTPARAAATPRKPRAKAEESVAEAGKAVKAKAPAKPRATKRSTTTAKRKAAGAKSAAKSATDKVGGGWGVAAIGAGVAVVGAAAAAAVLASRKKDDADPKPKGAKQADGTDASKSFAAGIADEGSIPKA